MPKSESIYASLSIEELIKSGYIEKGSKIRRYTVIRHADKRRNGDITSDGYSKAVLLGQTMSNNPPDKIKTSTFMRAVLTGVGITEGINTPDDLEVETMRLFAPPYHRRYMETVKRNEPYGDEAVCRAVFRDPRLKRIRELWTSGLIHDIYKSLNNMEGPDEFWTFSVVHDIPIMNLAGILLCSLDPNLFPTCRLEIKPLEGIDFFSISNPKNHRSHWVYWNGHSFYPNQQAEKDTGRLLIQFHRYGYIGREE